ncbi:TOG Alp14 [Schizosaccharomyces japonicus yFS275]|uniref:TOG Alp14 n=1 Tax=Schizosaccharomyces japonicus (strain yFS275 / FY16936) TaxID=402676 RepID=B6K4H9_SCHJY|nr:TOG Alp14 [Schizosaccharomyces japonicus yFS275]EEB08386.1 TOG Alp14 [Schizosaccharomyces japonicus yFS275]
MSGVDEEDYAKLPLSTRLTHKIWKVRLGAYEECKTQFSRAFEPTDSCFGLWTSNPDLWKNMLMDGNVAAQEAAVAAYMEFIKYASPDYVSKSIAFAIPAISEKCLMSSRAGTKVNSLEALQLVIEVGIVDPVVETLVASFGARLPKLVAANVHALSTLVESFGTKIIRPETIVPVLPKLFGHADKNVRKETVGLTVNLYRWVGVRLKNAIASDLKPVQMKELEAQFAALPEEKPTQKRLLRSQQAESKAVEAQPVPENQGLSASPVEDQSEQEDEYDLVEEVDVFSKIPPTLESALSSVKWKERKEALEDFLPVVSQPKIKDANFSDLVQMLAHRIVKDANVIVVTTAAKCLDSLAKGLHSFFHPYVSITINALLERSKERKASVIEALSAAMDSAFAASNLDALADEIAQFASHKNPQVRTECCHFLSRCLSKTTVLPSKSTVDVIASACVPGVNDTFEPVRNAAAETLGILMKLVGERHIAQYTDSLDDIRKAKVKSYFETATVSVKPRSSRPRPVASSANRNPATVRRPEQRSTSATANKPSLAKNTVLKSKSVSSPTPASPARRVSAERSSSSPAAAAKKKNAFEEGPLLPRPTTRPTLRSSKNHLAMRSLARGGSSQKGLLNETVLHLKKMDLEDSEPTPAKQTKVAPQQSTINVSEKMNALNDFAAERSTLLAQIQKEREEKSLLQRQVSELKREVASLKEELSNANMQQESRQTIARPLGRDGYSVPTSLSSFQRDNRNLDSFHQGLARSRLMLSNDPATRSQFTFNRSSSFAFQQPESPKRVMSRPPSMNLSSDWSRAMDLTAKLKEKIEQMKQTDLRHQSLI